MMQMVTGKTFTPSRYSNVHIYSMCIYPTCGTYSLPKVKVKVKVYY